MKTIEQEKAEIMAKAAADMQKAETKCTIIESLPVSPSFVHVYPLYGKIGTAKYNPVDVSDAVKIFKAFADKLPSFACKTNTCKSIKATYDEKADEVTECLFTVEIQKHSQSVCFMYGTPVGVIEVEIDMGFNPFGSYYIVDRNRTKYYRWEFRPENRLLGLLRVANYARTENYGDMSAPHMIYAGFEDYGFYDVMGVDREN